LSIRTSRTNGTLLVEIEDDGGGGASIDEVGGLRGLADRVEALGGRLTVESSSGRGTRVVGEIPCVP
jgi:signal transduction histidine kinase